MHRLPRRGETRFGVRSGLVGTPWIRTPSPMSVDVVAGALKVGSTVSSVSLLGIGGLRMLGVSEFVAEWHEFVDMVRD